MEVILSPSSHSYNAGYIAFSVTKPFDLPRHQLNILMGIYCGFYITTITVVTVQFVYRYWVVVHIEKIKYFEGWRNIFWISYIVCIAILWGGGSNYYFATCDKYSEKYMENVIFDFYKVNTSEITCIGIIAYDSDNNFRWFNLASMWSISVIMSLQYCIMLYCGIRLHLSMAKLIVNLSPSLQRLNKQMFKTLVIQIVAPSVVLTMPLTVTFYLTLLNIKINVPTGIILCGFSLFPCFDACFLMFTVSDYSNCFRMIGIVFASIEVLLSPSSHSYNAGYIVFSVSKPFNLSKLKLDKVMGNSIILIKGNDKNKVSAIYSGIYASTIALLAVQFIYRYWVVVHIERTQFFEGWKNICWVLYVFSVGAVWGTSNYYFATYDKFSEKYMEDVILDYYKVNTSDITCFGVIAYNSENKFRWYNLTSIFDMTILMSLQYCIMLYTGARLHLSMNKFIVNLSPSLQRLNKQMFKTLVIQIVAPSIVLTVPLTGTIYLTLLNLKLNIPTGIILCGFSLFPCFDACFLMYTVSDYSNCFRKVRNKLSNVSKVTYSIAKHVSTQMPHSQSVI
ncbi:unnamed protein product [Caenorhabditis angaria]|uniref:Serpentine receptor class r-10 n=1 Tax=Caenorhabditis angaria TaxID=860376 RepID=A0A9P1NBN0_9PELO|nr:unnamed protein product [Caenorhabditis angaria]